MWLWPSRSSSRLLSGWRPRLLAADSVTPSRENQPVLDDPLSGEAPIEPTPPGDGIRSNFVVFSVTIPRTRSVQAPSGALTHPTRWKP
jgi:hypothetical protein